MMTIKMLISTEPKPWFNADHEIEVSDRVEATVMLWALAKQEVPEFASCWLPGALEPHTNWHMRSLPVPDAIADLVAVKVEQINKAAGLAPAIAVEFINHRGETVRDRVRSLFNHENLLEPYARNTTEPAVVLTNYSWIPVSKIIRWVLPEGATLNIDIA